MKEKCDFTGPSRWCSKELLSCNCLHVVLIARWRLDHRDANGGPGGGGGAGSRSLGEEG